MKGQLEHLAEAGELPQVTLQAVPYDPSALDVVYVEIGSGDLFMESENDVGRYSTVFEHLAGPGPAARCLGIAHHGCCTRA